jgi:hypothetical protein
MGLADGMWYKIVRTVTECGNSCSSSYIIHRDILNCASQNNGTELRSHMVKPSTLPTQKSESTSISAYPSPTSGLINVTDSFGDVFKNVDVYNSLGIKVLSKSIISKTYQLDISYMPSGMYMVVVVSKNGTAKQQIIKE